MWPPNQNTYNIGRDQDHYNIESESTLVSQTCCIGNLFTEIYYHNSFGLGAITVGVWGILTVQCLGMVIRQEE